MDKQKKIKIIHSDYVILGSGIAGLFAALKLAQKGTVSIITKDNIKESNSSYAQGGIAAALIPPDTIEKHYEDTMKAGDYHNNTNSVKILTEEGPLRVCELIEMGVNFDKKKNELLLSKEGAHSEARVLHHKDFTGSEIINILIKHVKNNTNIKIYESLFVYQLLVEKNICKGCLAFNKTTHYQFNSGFVILATGGAGKLYKYTSNPAVSTGDGYILAHDAGCKLVDMEFIQFHPTTFLYDKANAKVFLITEAIRGDGAFLENDQNENFMKYYDKNENLAARDIVSRAIFKESESGKKPVYLNFSKLQNEIKEKYPTIYSFCLNQNIDIKKSRLPITPAAHYMMGGIYTNTHAETNINNLYAIGEVACTGVHGANRLASNSLLEAIVFAERAAQNILNKPIPSSKTKTTQIPKEYNSSPNLHHIQQKIQTIMWEKAGIIRNEKKLNSALKEINLLSKNLDYFILNKEHIETKNMITLSKIIIRSAIKRKHSLGAHFIQPN